MESMIFCLHRVRYGIRIIRCGVADYFTLGDVAFTDSIFLSFKYKEFITHSSICPESFAPHSNQFSLECQVNSTQYISSSSIKWFKDGVLIDHVSNGRYSMIQQNGLIRLSIVNPNETDSGEYTCEIGLPGQPVRSVSQHISVKPSITVPVPEMRLKNRHSQKHAIQREHGEKNVPHVALASFMKNLTIEEGGRAKFVCSVIGQVDTVEWFKDNVQLQPESHCRYHDSVV